MSLAPGTRLGPYEILGPLGSGGMGEVYRARDPRLNRDVAIKTSAARFSERFEREAHAIAALNHPHICQIYDVGPDYLVMELVDGAPVKGPLPLDQALKLAIQLAGAIAAAHHEAITHRDLKPANILKTKSGIKVLDFGLAKIEQAKAAAANDETVTRALTQEGAIVGTLQYMAPEQLNGKTVDSRADIFSFGCVLYEMLTGKRAFDGATAASVIAGILEREPPSVGHVAPAALDRLLKRCFAKDPDYRYQSAGDLKADLEWIASSGGMETPTQTHGLSSRIPWALAGVAMLGLAVLAFSHFREKPPAHVVTRFEFPLPEGQRFMRRGRHLLALSPDGAKLVYSANHQLYLRAMEQLEPRPVKGANGDLTEPVFSPDGQWVAYFVLSDAGSWILKKIPVAGGGPVTLGAVAAPPYGATWSDGMIVFGMNVKNLAAIQAMPDSGGALRTLVTGNWKNERLTQPRLLADGKHVLFISVPSEGDVREGQIVVESLNGKERTILVSRGADPHLLPGGQLVYIDQGTLLAVPFDASRLSVTGGPVPLVEGIMEVGGPGGGSSASQFAISSDGTMAFSPAETIESQLTTLTWVDRQGHEEPIPTAPRAYQSPRLSPDGSKIAVSSVDDERGIWVFDLARNELTRLTFGPDYEISPVWSLNNRHLLFSSGPPSGVAPIIERKAADGTGTVETLTKPAEGGDPLSLTPDGKSLVFARFEPLGLFVLPLDPQGTAHPLIPGARSNTMSGEISPDGRWIAYNSDESGRSEIYVRPFPAVNSGRWQISAEGGAHPIWARSGRELFFVTAARGMVAVPVLAGSGFNYGKQQPLFDVSGYAARGRRPYDISADGKRFLMLKIARSGNPPRSSIVVVSHWFDEVSEKMAGHAK